MKQKTNILKNLIRNVGTWRAMSATKKTNTGLARITWHAMSLQALAMAALTLSSCSMINEELPECAPAPDNYTLVDFVYTYNMSPTMNNTGEEEDWFDDHVGSVYLYIFDHNGVYVDRREKHRELLSPDEDFTMRFSDKELLPGETYNFVAVAQGNTIGYVEDDDYQWFKLVNPMVPGESRIEDYILKLDRETPEGFTQIGVLNYKDQIDGETKQMIDTLWTTKPDEVQTKTIKKVDYKPTIEQQPDVVTHVTIPMMRITNAITINMYNPSFDQDFDVNQYHVVIHFPNGNGTVDFVGDISQSSQELFYQSLIKQMVPYNSKDLQTKASSGVYDPNEGETDAYALQANFGVSRLMVGDESTLQIRDATQAENGYPVLLEIPFTETLAKLNADTGFSKQEFLDREYDFQLDIAVDDKMNGLYMDVSCRILSWAKRIFFYEL